MQTQFGAAAEKAILSPERFFRARVLVDWNMNGQYDHAMSDMSSYIASVSVDRSLKGSAPEEVLLIEGSSSAELTLTVEGEYAGWNLSALFSPYNTASPFYGKTTVGAEIKYSIIVDSPDGQFEYPKFVGTVRTITPSRGDAKVEITALDRAEMMRRAIQLPPFAMSDEHVSYGELDSQLVRSAWVIDHCCRLSDTGVSPKRPAYRQELGLAPGASSGVQIWISGNGSYLPTIGYLDNLNADTFPNPGTAMYVRNGPVHPNAPTGTAQPFGLAGLGLPIQQRYGTPGDQGVIRYWVADADQLDPASHHIVGFTINTNGTRANDVFSIGQFGPIEIYLGYARRLAIFIQNGGIWVERWKFGGGTYTVDFATSAVAIPSGQQSVDVLVQCDFTPGNSKVYIKAGSNSNGGFVNYGSAVTYAADQGADQIKGRFTISQAVNLSDIFYATTTFSTATNRTDLAYRQPKYVAVLDDGLNQFSYIPSAKKQEAWQIVQEVAAAEFGSVFWDESGVFRFWNWNTMLSKRSNVVRTYSLDDVSGLQLTNTFDSVRNIYSVRTSKKRAASGVTKVYESSDVNEFYVPPRTEKRFRIWLDNLVSPLTFNIGRYGGGGTSALTPFIDTTDHGFVLQWFGTTAANIWTEDDSIATPLVNAYFTSDGYVTVRVRNDASYAMRFAKGENGDASPAFRFAGTLIRESSELDILYENTPSILKYGPRSLDLSGDWFQDSLSVTNMFDVLLPRTGEPVPTTDAITVAGDPRLQLGDVIAVTDPDGFGANMLLQLYGIKSDFSLEDGLTDTLTVEVCPPPPPAPAPGDPTPLVTHYNLCPNPGLGRDSSNWYGGSRVGVSGMVRSNGYQVSSGGQVICPQGNVKVGRTYRFSAYLKGGGSTSGSCYIDWYSNNGYMSSTAGMSWSVSSGGVVRVDTGDKVAPIGASKALLVINGFSTSVTVTGVLYEEISTLSGYGDGESTNGRWDGQAYNSTSRYDI